MIFRIFMNYFHKKNEKRWREWKGVINQLDEDYRLSLGKIVSIRKKARTGTKVYIYWHGNMKEKHAIWIPKCWPNSGDYILGRGSFGYGDHHKEEVFYLNDAVKIVKCNAYRGYVSHLKRISLNNSSDA